MFVDDDPLLDVNPFPEVVNVNPEKAPNFKFPESLRTFDTSLNRFIDRFARICMEGKYSEFRLMCTGREPPISPRRFESIFSAVREIRIRKLTRLTDVPAANGPVYIMKAEYDLEEHAARDGPATREVQVAIAREGGTWRIGPIPSAVAAALARLDPESDISDSDVLFPNRQITPPDDIQNTP
jgi:hypothetical protein